MRQLVTLGLATQLALASGLAAQQVRGFNLRNLFDTSRNLGALQAYAERNLRQDLWLIYAGAAPAEWAGSWSSAPMPLEPGGLVPPYALTARDYLSSLGQVVFEHAAGCDGTPGEVAHALWELGSGLEWINANATRDCLDCLSSAWRRLVPRFSAVGRYFPTVAGFAALAQEEADNPPRTAEEIPGYNTVSANLVQSALVTITDALGDGISFFGCMNGRVVAVEALAIPGMEAGDLRFYEGPWEGVPPERREYSEHFTSDAARVIHYELGLSFPPLAQAVSFDLDVTWFRADGSVLTRQQRVATADAGSRSAGYWQGWGRREPGVWQPGAYRVEARINGRLVATGNFALSAAAPAPASCPRQPVGRPFLETHSPGNPAVQWYPNGPRRLASGYTRARAPTQWLLGEEGDGYTLYVIRDGAPVREWRLDRAHERPPPQGWAEGGLGYAVQPDGERRATGSTNGQLLVEIECVVPEDILDRGASPLVVYAQVLAERGIACVNW